MAPRPIHRLSSLAVKRAVKRGMHADGGGLYLQVNDAGNRSWIFRYRSGLTRRHFGLGSANTVSLHQAREFARDARLQLLQGDDPITARREKIAAKRLAAAKTITFRQAADAFIEAHRKGWKNEKHAGQWTASLARHAHPVIGDLAVAAIDTSLVVRVLEPIWLKHAETAGRIRGRIEAILDWAKVRGFRDGENPARWEGHLDHVLPLRPKNVTHFAALPHADMPAFMAALREHDDMAAARALEFTILTASRSGPVFQADWAEIDLEAKIWTVPGQHMKGNRAFRVALSDDALATLGAPSSGPVFPGLSKNSMTRLLRDMGYGVSVHGFRSTFTDWCRHNHINAEVREAALAHVQRDRTIAAYARDDLLELRRPVMDAWAADCAGAAQGANVLPMSKRA
jgi:integrase